MKTKEEIVDAAILTTLALVVTNDPDFACILGTLGWVLGDGDKISFFDECKQDLINTLGAYHFEEQIAQIKTKMKEKYKI